MGNPGGHFCCSAGDEFADAAAPSCGGDLEDEASAADLAAGLRVSQPCSHTALAGWLTLKTPLRVTLTTWDPPQSTGSASLLLLSSYEKRIFFVILRP